MLQHLTSLDCGKNYISAIPDFLTYPLLTDLVLFMNELRSFPKLSHPSLQSLNLNRNYLSEIELGYCPMLEQLSLSYNQLMSVNALSCCGLIEVDISVNKLKRLEEVKLMSCKLLLWKDNEFPYEPTLLGRVASQFFGASKVDDEIFSGKISPLPVWLQMLRTFRTAL